MARLGEWDLCLIPQTWFDNDLVPGTFFDADIARANRPLSLSATVQGDGALLAALSGQHAFGLLVTGVASVTATSVRGRHLLGVVDGSVLLAASMRKTLAVVAEFAGVGDASASVRRHLSFGIVFVGGASLLELLTIGRILFDVVSRTTALPQVRSLTSLSSVSSLTSTMPRTQSSTSLIAIQSRTSTMPSPRSLTTKGTP